MKCKRIIIITLIIITGCCTQGDFDKDDQICEEMGIRYYQGLSYASTCKYCRYVKEATHKDKHALKKLFLMDFQGGYSYDHGTILITILDKTGEEFFIQVLQEEMPKRQMLVRNYLLFGLDHVDNPKYHMKPFYEVFPLLGDFLCEKLGNTYGLCPSSEVP